MKNFPPVRSPFAELKLDDIAIELIQCPFHLQPFCRFHRKDYKSAAAGARDFTGNGSRLNGPLHRLFDDRITEWPDAIAFLSSPALSEDSGEGRDVPLKQCFLHVYGILFNAVHGFDSPIITLRRVSFLFVDNLRGTAGSSRIIQQYTGFQFIDDPFLDA